jgi:hypothetical protein
MRLSQLSKYATLAGVLVMPLAVSAPAAHADPAEATASAYGLEAVGPVAIPRTAEVASAGKRPVRKNLTELPANPLMDATALRTSAAPGQGRADVADLRMSKIGFSADKVTAQCDNGTGDARLSRIALDGRELKLGTRPNTTITRDIEGVGTVGLTANKQSRTSDGRLALTALELRVPFGPGKLQTIGVSSVTCGKPKLKKPAQKPGGNGGHQGGHGHGPDSGPAAPRPGAAPAPNPVRGDLPVTG